MDLYLWLVATFLLANLALGLSRVIRGPSRADRMLAAQLFGTLGVAILLIIAQVQATPSLRDVALVLALTAPIAAVSFVRRHMAANRGERK